MVNFGTREVAATGVMAALCFVATYLIMIPIPATSGYFNVGDVFVIISGLVFGPLVGGLAGGVGSALSDLLGGYYPFVPFTLIIKGCEGLVAGYVGGRLATAKINRIILAWALGGVCVVLGYFVAETVFLTGMSAALIEVPVNLLQVVVAGVIGVPVSKALKTRIKL
jgi:uncharacterized membrane protein